MNLPRLIAAITICILAQQPFATAAPGDVAAGKNLFSQSCSACHAQNGAQDVADTAPPVSFMARDSKERPDFIRGRLMNPHSPMPGFMHSRQQIDDIIAYLRSVPPQ